MSSNNIQVQLCKKYNNITNQSSKCCWTNKLSVSLSASQSFDFDGDDGWWKRNINTGVGTRDGGENLGACENFELDGPDVYIKGETDTK